MKKICLFLLIFSISFQMVQAKDYAKLQLEEMKKTQKYSAMDKYFNKYLIEGNNNLRSDIKDPKILNLGNYKEISDRDFRKKINNDKIKYTKIAKLLDAKSVDNYNSQPYGTDFYKVYRIAERIIRANNLDFMNWRISIDKDESFNASSSNINLITINSGLLDTLSDSEDALAMVIAHEISHTVLGHSLRKEYYIKKMQRAKRAIVVGPRYAYMSYRIAQRKYLRESRRMEFSADIEGAKMVAKAGYKLDNMYETISLINTVTDPEERFSSHPKPEKRLENYKDNSKYFVVEEWEKQGRYNIYNSDVLDCSLSSNRRSIVISKGTKKNSDKYYHPENIEQIYIRYAYGAYLHGDFNDSLKYFGKYFELNDTNASAYLYASYASEALYKENQNEKYLEKAKNYIEKAHSLDKKNKYINEQIENL